MHIREFIFEPQFVQNYISPLPPPPPPPLLQLAGELGAQAVSHLERVSAAGISAMAEAGVTAVLLPTTAYLLRLQPPPARALMDMGMSVCLFVCLFVRRGYVCLSVSMSTYGCG